MMLQLCTAPSVAGGSLGWAPPAGQPARAPARIPAAAFKRQFAGGRCVAVQADASVRVKLGMAADRGQLDLSECDLEEIPPEVFDIPGLLDLSLAGNNLATLPPEIGRLTALERLQLSGNLFETVPDEIGNLPNLKGLWLHGNVLRQLPDSLGGLTSLRQLCLSGNQLAALPPSINRLTALEELEVAGNRLTTLPEVGALTALVKLAAFGNALESLPASIGSLASLQHLWLQGNQLSTLPPSVCRLEGLVELSIADNWVEELPPECTGLTSLRSFSIYGNRMHRLPGAVLGLPSLRALWLEANPLDDAGDLRPSSEEAHHLSLGPALKNVGLDQFQVGRLPRAVLNDLAPVLRPGEVADVHGRGYFKLKRAERRDDGFAAIPAGQPRLLVVVFGSAPGVPNWGSLLQRASDGMEDDEQRHFDTLFVVDSYRAWYGGGDDTEYDYYMQRLRMFTSRYEKTLLIGDSMGGTAGLMFSGLATAVHAFTPQVNLEASSIRPGNGREWHRAMRCRIHREVAASSADITIHCGNWLHDLRQAREVPAEEAALEIYDLDSHRLPYHLDRRGELVPCIQRAIKKELGFPINAVRLANLL